ncbi:hypothetical protein OE88DRAFT_1716275 [Heliocybe sulcata]|uniref:RING-type domain-containing protein n=1 Tax=Heliocybe sulcata TaxID=5364 RepID=A0A5C3NEN8_9AGAM|nr:hypothetical protein OE88DRAFT_1716275 [Heliocybe sulcata]
MRRLYMNRPKLGSSAITRGEQELKAAAINAMQNARLIPSPTMQTDTLRQYCTETERHEIAQEVLQGRQRVVTFPGSSQYGRTGGGTSACGLAALNCARIILGKSKNGLQGTALLESIMERATLQNILGICQSWSNSSHLEVEEISGAPIFAKTLALKDKEYSATNVRLLSELLQRAKPATSEPAAAVVITRPPEILVCMIIPVEEQAVFVTFDSHPRPKYPAGAAFTFDTSLKRTAEYLAELLPYDRQLLRDSSIQWEAQMLAQYSGHVFVARDIPDIPADWMESLMEASVSSLALKAEVVSLQSRNDSLTSDNVRLGRDVQRLQTELQALRRQQERSRHPANQRTGQSSKTSQSSKGKAPEIPRSIGIRGFISSFSAVVGSSDDRKGDPPRSPAVADSGKVPDDVAGIASQEDEDLDYAIQMQLEFDMEDVRLRTVMEELQDTVQPTFDCMVCLETIPLDYVAPLDSCKHLICTECLRGHVRSKLQEGRFPILCPVCMTEKDNEGRVISNLLAQQLGLTEEEFETFMEFEMTAFSILIHCRSCEKSVFVDKQEYKEAEIITCPLFGCQYTWCKRCSQEAALDGDKHSCDGSTELQNLMQQRGWKICPGCNTPTEKTSGCNHMTCPTPSCNTHFCYRCGNMIIQSLRQEDIAREVTAHYRTCNLFVYPE